jgi:hypothetical protein
VTNTACTCVHSLHVPLHCCLTASMLRTAGPLPVLPAVFLLLQLLCSSLHPVGCWSAGPGDCACADPGSAEVRVRDGQVATISICLADDLQHQHLRSMNASDKGPSNQCWTCWQRPYSFSMQRTASWVYVTPSHRPSLITAAAHPLQVWVQLLNPIRQQ